MRTSFSPITVIVRSPLVDERDAAAAATPAAPTRGSPLAAARIRPAPCASDPKAVKNVVAAPRRASSPAATAPPRRSARSRGLEISPAWASVRRGRSHPLDVPHDRALISHTSRHRLNGYGAMTVRLSSASKRAARCRVRTPRAAARRQQAEMRSRDVSRALAATTPWSTAGTCARGSQIATRVAIDEGRSAARDRGRS